MARVGSIIIVSAVLALPTHAGDEIPASDPDGPATSTDRGSDVTTLLRAIAVLVEAHAEFPKTQNLCLDEMVNAAPSTSHRTTVIELKHVPAKSVADTIQQFLDDRAVFRTHMARDGEKLKLVAEEESNKLIVSGSREYVRGILELVRKLDTKPDLVLVELLIAERVSRGGRQSDPVSEAYAPDVQKHPAAWFSWARKHGFIEVVSRPQIMTLNNQSGLVQISGNVEGEKAKGEFSVRVTPQIATGGDAVAVEINAAKSEIEAKEGSPRWVKREVSTGTTVTTDDGKTVVVSGLFGTADEPELIIALTPHVVR